jgi:glycosyltransferase involved in cell wall biosynthesis
MHDLWHMKRFAGTFPGLPAGVLRVLYLPLDGELVHPEIEPLLPPLEVFDVVVTYTPGFREALERETRSLPKPPRVVDLPHGLDASRFHAAPELLASGFDPAGRRAARQAVFGERPTWLDPFVVLNPSRPASRKRIDLTLEAFAEFARDKPADVMLCLHQAIRGEPEAAQRDRRIDELGIGHRVLLDPVGPGVASDQRLNTLYNACDVGLTTTMGEGWGLVAFEHAAAGGAQVMPRHSACGELWQGAALLVEPARFYVPTFSPLRMGEVSPVSVAQALDDLYRDRARLRSLARAGWERARSPALDWQTIGAAWRELFASQLKTAS